MKRHLIWLCLLLLTLGIKAQGELRISLSPTSPTVGEDVELRLTLVNLQGNIGNLRPPAQLGGLNFNWRNISQSRKHTLVNGSASYEHTLSWRGKATQEGSFQMSPITIELDGKVLQSPSLSFNVVQAQTSQFFLVRASVDRKEVPLGGVLHLNVDYCLADQVVRQAESAIGGYELAQNHYDAKVIPPLLKENFHVAVLKGRDAQGQSAYYGESIDHQMIDGFLYRVHRITLELEPKKSGRLEIPPWQTSFYRLGNFRRNIFGQTSASRVGGPLSATSEAIYIKVTDPPQAGQPDTFSGQVCRELNIQVEIEDIQEGQTVQLHAPLSLRITLSSDRRGIALQQPEFENQAGWTKAFDINTQAMQREDLEHQAIFSGIIVRPRDKNITELPPIKVSYYNIDSQSYTTVASQAIPLNIEAVSDEEALNQQAIEVLKVQKKDEKEKSIAHIHGLETDAHRLFSKSSSAWPWSLVAIPASLMWLAGGCWTLLWPWWKDHRGARQNDLSASTVRQNLRQSSSPSQILDLMTKYLQRQHQVADPSTFTSHNEELQRRVRQLIVKLESAGYAPSSSTDGHQLQKEALELLTSLAKEQH